MQACWYQTWSTHKKIIAFLNVSGDWDPSLAFVMIGAIGVFSPIYHLFIKKRQQAIYGEPLTCIQHKNVDMHLIIGAVIFGIGWGLGGFCPGPAITSMANISPIIVIFIASLLLGSFLGRRYKKD